MEQSNKLIAEFMGWEYDENNDWYFTPHRVEVTDGIYDNEIPSDLFEFHSSWDWLIPVAEKCLTSDEKTDGQHYFINDALLTCDIDVVYDRVLEFIKDYNQND